MKMQIWVIYLDYYICISLASLSGCRVHHIHPSEFLKMAETCIINIRDLPGRKLRKRVRVFLKGEAVSVEDEEGQTYGVTIQRNKVLISPVTGN